MKFHYVRFIGSSTICSLTFLYMAIFSEDKPDMRLVSSFLGSFLALLCFSTGFYNKKKKNEENISDELD